jgi:hypothetical protein
MMVLILPGEGSAPLASSRIANANEFSRSNFWMICLILGVSRLTIQKLLPSRISMFEFNCLWFAGMLAALLAKAVASAIMAAELAAVA